MAKIDNAGMNIVPFLDTIAYTEGTDNGRQTSKDQGYDVLVGGKLFTSYADHPRVLVKLNATLSSTAAGRYQILSRFWDAYKGPLGLKDFSPINQDKYAINQLKERGAIKLLQEGDFEGAILRCNNIWASLPESPYGQHTYSMAATKAIFLSKGGYC